MADGLVRPAPAVEVEHHRARRGGDVGHEPAGQGVEQPGVGRGHDALGGPVPAQPGQLRRREVRVEREPGDGGQPVAVRSEAVGDRGGPPVLPRQRGRQRAAAGAVPGQHRLPLVGEADAVHHHPGLGDGGPAGRQHRRQQFGRVLLDRTVPGGVRVHRALGHAQDRPAVPHHQGLGGRGALVDGQDVHRPASRRATLVSTITPPRYPPRDRSRRCRSSSEARSDAARGQGGIGRAAPAAPAPRRSGFPLDSLGCRAGPLDAGLPRVTGGAGPPGESSRGDTRQVQFVIPTVSF